MNNVLKGATILVARPAHQAAYLCQLIEQQGGTPVRFPTLEIVGVDNENPATFVHDNLSNPHWLIFTSANAVNFALKANGGKIVRLNGAQIAAIGKATAKELEVAGLQVTMIPKDGYDSEALLAMPEMQHVNGQDIWIVRGQGGREELANVLRNRGAKVEYWEVYQRVMPNFDNAYVLALLKENRLSGIVITSCEALQNLMKMIGESYQGCLVAIPLVVISERISDFAAKMGFMRIAVTENPSDPAILNTLIGLINEE
ncbi:MAG: uroporphyrinogen-III synthase [Methyloglobulus sp.]|nr:uroporphyrinogen-III synthase [Methyloglobulus sp.]